MSKILFIISGKERRLGLGDVAMIASPVYYRGMELGFNDITLQWPDIVTGPNHEKVKCPKDTILPIKFIEREKINKDEYDKILDLKDKGTLYLGFPGIDYNPDSDATEIKNMFGVYNFNNMYSYITKTSPIFYVDKEKLKKPYVLLHHRDYEKHPTRNSNETTTLLVFKILREMLGDKYEIWKMGEPTLFDDKFDKVLPTFNDDPGEYFKVINNSSMVLGNGQSGVTVTANFFNIPVVRLDINLNSKIARTLLSVYYWSLIGGIGYTYYDWVDESKNLRYTVNSLNEEELRGFIEKWLL